MNRAERDIYRHLARATLERIGAKLGQDFHTLNSGQVDTLLVEAKRSRYQKPASANGSRARYFYDRLQRQARGG